MARLYRRYEIIDSELAEWPGTRFSDLDRALRELDHAVPKGRFYVRDRETGEHFDIAGNIIGRD